MRVSYKKQIILFMIFILLTSIIVELVIRNVDIIKPQCDFVNSKLFSNLTNSEKNQMCEEYNSLEYDYSQPLATLKPNQKGKFVNINSDGFRGKEINFTDNVYKIFFLGGSTTFGIVTTSDEKTIPGQVEEILKKKGYNVEIVNAGVGKSTTIDEIYILKEKVLHYQPNMIVMYDGWNDVVQFERLKLQLSYEEYLKNNHYRNNEIENKKLNNQGTGIIKYFEKIDYRTGLGIILFLKDLIRQVDTQVTTNNLSRDIDSVKLSKIESTMIENWSEVCSLGKNNGFRTINIIQPILGTDARHVNADEIKLLSSSEYGKYLKMLKLEKRLDSCENVVDLREAFSDRNEILIYYDPGHMSDFGYRIVAERITEEIIPIIEKDSS